MNLEQKVVAIGAASGVVAMVAAVALLTWLIPVPISISNSVAERISYALIGNVFAVIPLFVMLATIGNERFLSAAIDPTRHAEDEKMQINARVAENTLQQTVVFFIVSMTVATLVPFDHLQIVWACAVWFVIARFAFWIGYRIHPLFRAPGMSGTAYMNLFMIIYVLHKVLPFI